MANKWTYASDGGEKYPVSYGQLWTVNGHLYHCQDLEAEKSDWTDDVARLRPKLVYTDPPWGAGNARTFRTKAGVDGALGRAVNTINLHKKILEPFAALKILAYVETGLREEHELKRVAAELGGVCVGRWDITYYQTKPCVLFAFDFGETKPYTLPNLNGMDDDDTPLAVFKHHLAEGFLREGNLIADPCAGRGLTAASANRVGLQALTNELHPNRISCAMWKINKATNAQPQRIR
jgi:hypothetical protein